MNLRVESNLARFNSAFSQYVETWAADGKTNKDGSPRTLEDAIEKKGRDIGIRLFQGFRDHKWGGPGKHPGLARAELDARVAEGKGIKVRASLMSEYLAERGELRARLRGKNTVQGTIAKVNLWQKFVGKELSLRQRGIGVLAVAFLWYRSRSNNAQGTFYVKNRTGKPIGAVERGSGFFRIIGDAPGSSEVDARYGIVSGALAGAADDMLKYINSREREQFSKAFSLLSA